MLLLAALVIFIYNIFTVSRIKTEEGISFVNTNKIEMEKQLNEMLDGYPMKQMIPHILEKDPKVAAFLVSIAKKESNWGKRVPVLDGKDCFNYWGYRGIRDRMGSGGHTCFDNPKDAVDTVGERLEELIVMGIDTPGDMVVWKCGSSCDTHSSSSVAKWISDVKIFFQKLN